MCKILSSKVSRFHPFLPEIIFLLQCFHFLLIQDLPPFLLVPFLLKAPPFPLPHIFLSFSSSKVSHFLLLLLQLLPLPIKGESWQDVAKEVLCKNTSSLFSEKKTHIMAGLKGKFPGFDWWAFQRQLLWCSLLLIYCMCSFYWFVLLASEDSTFDSSVSTGESYKTVSFDPAWIKGEHTTW